ncbi:response regulator [Microbacterium sp. IEGM 1404]|uniref:response regulator n=1 Tax=Microbacterium sp. IEGM 1404 TaxID=3047084 RepID=UPI0024B74BD2|nr:response regulator transcription factor [Microbacterium sp. IEGM 1404]MDI9890899.1 response regulator transcription factor [Microbacterium sp. IEGM 1404]
MPPGGRKIIRIGIVDDHPAVVIGTAAFLNAQPDLRVLTTGSTVNQLLRDSPSLDVVLLDLVLADRSSPAENIAALSGTHARIIAYTSGDRPQLIRDAARAGADGMIRKSESPRVVIDAVRAVHNGEVSATTDWAAALDQDTHFVDAALSTREAEVLGLYASGETAEHVALLLHISRETVLDHIRRVRAKYAAVERTATTKVDLLRRAVEDGIVEFGR